MAAFLCSPGSDNAPLAAKLTETPRWWLAPVQVPLDDLARLAGPPGAPVLEVVDEDTLAMDKQPGAHPRTGGKRLVFHRQAR